jgi:hypothetical protein
VNGLSDPPARAAQWLAASRYHWTASSNDACLRGKVCGKRYHARAENERLKIMIETCGGMTAGLQGGYKVVSYSICFEAVFSKHFASEGFCSARINPEGGAMNAEGLDRIRVEWRLGARPPARYSDLSRRNYRRWDCRGQSRRRDHSPACI